jgi:hypothetical protein
MTGSNASTADGLAGREYFGGSAAANARRTAFCDTSNRLEIAPIGIPSARCNRRISAQSSTANTPLTVAQGFNLNRHVGVSFRSAPTRFLHRNDKPRLRAANHRASWLSGVLGFLLTGMPPASRGGLWVLAVTIGRRNDVTLVEAPSALWRDATW